MATEIALKSIKQEAKDFLNHAEEQEVNAIFWYGDGIDDDDGKHGVVGRPFHLLAGSLQVLYSLIVEHIAEYEEEEVWEETKEAVHETIDYIFEKGDKRRKKNASRSTVKKIAELKLPKEGNIEEVADELAQLIVEGLKRCREHEDEGED